MLKILRKKGIAKKLLWVLAIIITLSFMLWGVSSSLQQTSSVKSAGRIFNRKVSFEDFQRALLHVRNQAIMRYGENFYQISQFLDLDSQAWDRLILLHEAKERKVKIPDAQVVAAVSEFPFFQRDGAFDKALYDQIVQYVFRCRPRDFEEGVRESLMFKKIFDDETAFINVSEDDVLKEYQKQNEKVQVEYVLFSTSDYEKEVSSLEEEVQKYYESHKNDFKIPSTINVSYLALEYPKEATDEQKDSIKKKAADIAGDIAGELSLEDIAKKYELEIKTSGFFSKEQPKMDLGWPLEIFQRALSLKIDELAGPMETNKGYYLLKLQDQKESYVPDFEQAKEKARKAIVTQKAKIIAQEKAKQALAQIQEFLVQNPNAKFAQAVKKVGQNIQQSPLFTHGQYLPQIGPAPQFHQAAFMLSDEEKISDVIETSGGYAILSLVSFEPIDEAKFEEEKEVLSEKLLVQKKEEAFNAFLTRLRIKAQLQNNLKALEKSTENSQN
ncbi:MAG: SurA N-terminal domain-containing protein [Candidatus Aceula meridiana]|nr:SurA N-terminal domain-containing protein [Candidatus Aceula meridiana]